MLKNRLTAAATFLAAPQQPVHQPLIFRISHSNEYSVQQYTSLHPQITIHMTLEVYSFLDFCSPIPGA
jgi:hypothetical protein